MEGRFAEAKRMADEFGANAAAMAKEMPPAESFATAPMLMLIRFGKWEEVVRAPEVQVGPLSTVLSHFARGVAFARMGDVPAAEREHEQFEEARKALTDEPGLLQNSPKNVARVAGGILDGRIAEAKGDRAQALRAYRRAVEVQDTLDYNEPADWFYPARETLGGALLRAGQYAEAEKVFKEDLKQSPNNPRSLFGLAEARRKQKKSAATATAEFKKYWHGGAVRIEDL